MAPRTRIASDQHISTGAVGDSGLDLGTSVTAENYPSTLSQSLEYYSQAFEAAAQNIDSSAGDSTGEGTSFGSQTGNVAVWANGTGKLIPDRFFHGLVVISESTSEHKVYFRETDRRAVKKTWAGFYGQVPSPNGGKLDRKNATPAEYLRRMSLQINIFGSDLRLEGVCISDAPSMIIGEPAGQPSLVVSQLWIDKFGTATNENIREYLVEEGFLEVPGSYYGWFRPDDCVVIVDAKPDNFIRTEAGLVPIDLQMAIFTEAQVLEAGLSDLKKQQVSEGCIILPPA